MSNLKISCPKNISISRFVIQENDTCKQYLLDIVSHSLLTFCHNFTVSMTEKPAEIIYLIMSLDFNIMNTNLYYQ